MVSNTRQPLMFLRLLPYEAFDGATNMAADEVMLQGAADGVASLRSYGWSSATVSLGYFQPAGVRRADPRLAALPWVRRPSGGATLVHHHELTYAIALPPGASWHAEPWMPRMHRIITRVLAEMGVVVAGVLPSQTRRAGKDTVLCFLQHTPGDLLCAGQKVVGSAQRKHRQALMQHGSILLAQSEHAPELPGIRECAGITLTPTQVEESLRQAFVADTGWNVAPSDWTAAERVAVGDLAVHKYASATWNERR